MNAPPIDWDRIENFIGFGPRTAPVVFVGMEEGLDSALNLKSDLVRRSAFEAVMDLREAHRGIVNADRRFDPVRVATQPTWRPMCHLLLRRRGLANPTLPQRRLYQAEELGRSSGETLLTELLPYPHTRANEWSYAEFGRFGDRKTYKAAMLGRRKDLLRSVLWESSRELIVCYGKADWHHFKELFPLTITWHSAGPFETATTGETHIVLTPHFSGREFNSDAQLQNFADVALRIRRRGRGSPPRKNGISLAGQTKA